MEGKGNNNNKKKPHADSRLSSKQKQKIKYSNHCLRIQLHILNRIAIIRVLATHPPASVNRDRGFFHGGCSGVPIYGVRIDDHELSKKKAPLLSPSRLLLPPPQVSLTHHPQQKNKNGKLQSRSAGCYPNGREKSVDGLHSSDLLLRMTTDGERWIDRGGRGSRALL